MSIEIESGCVGCGLRCLGRSCPYYEVEVMYCDNCGQEMDSEENYGKDFGEDICKDCWFNGGIKKEYEEEFGDV